MSILIKLRDIRDLPDAEAQVRKYILANSREILNFTVYDLARESYTSPATVIRLCKRLDIKGFTKFKLLLAQELKYFEYNQINLLDSTIIEKNDSPDTIVEKITNITIKTIEETRVLVNIETMVQVANIILKASIIDFYGVGASNIVAMDATYKFMRIGKNVASYQLYDRQYVQAVNSNSNRAGPFSPDNNLAFLLKTYLYENFDGLPLTWSLYGHGFMPWGMALKEGHTSDKATMPTSPYQWFA